MLSIQERGDNHTTLHLAFHPLEGPQSGRRGSLRQAASGRRLLYLEIRNSYPGSWRLMSLRWMAGTSFIIYIPFPMLLMSQNYSVLMSVYYKEHPEEARLIKQERTEYLVAKVNNFSNIKLALQNSFY